MSLFGFLFLRYNSFSLVIPLHEGKGDKITVENRSEFNGKELKNYKT